MRAVPSHAARDVAGAHWDPTHLAVNSSKLSSWWPLPPSSLLSDSWRAEELKELAEPEETIMAGTAKRALELRGLRQRRPLARKKVEGLARVATRSSEVDDMGRGGGGRVAMERLDVVVLDIFQESSEKEAGHGCGCLGNEAAITEVRHERGQGEGRMGIIAVGTLR